MSDPAATEQRSPRVARSIRASLNRRALAAVRHRAALARVLELAESDVLAIQYLAQEGALTSSQLGLLLRLSSGGTTALVQRLEREGCIAREPNPHDRRSTLLRLTPDIERRAGAAVAPLVEEIDRLVARLTPQEGQVVEEFLLRVAEASEREAEALTRSADARSQDAPVSPVPGLWA